MAKLGSKKKPIVVRVHSEEKARYVANTCDQNGWRYIIGFEPDKPEDISRFYVVYLLHHVRNHFESMMTEVRTKLEFLFICF